MKTYLAPSKSGRASLIDCEEQILRTGFGEGGTPRSRASRPSLRAFRRIGERYRWARRTLAIAMARWTASASALLRDG